MRCVCIGMILFVLRVVLCCWVIVVSSVVFLFGLV